MLPTDRPIVPLVLYEEYNFPLSVMVNPPNLCSHLVQKTAAMLANEATSRASNNPARMYTFNVLVMNNWNNNEFQEILNYVMWYIYLEVKRGNYPSPEMAIADCVNRYMTMYASTMALTVEAVRSVVTPQHIDASAQNAEVFHNLKLEIQHMQNQMYQTNGGYPQQPMMQQPMYPQQPMVQQPMYPQQPMMQQPMYQQPMYPQQPQHFQQQMPQQPMVNNQGFMQQGGPMNARQALDTMANGGVKADVTNDRFGKNVNQKQYFEEQPYQKPVQATPPPPLAPEVVKGIEELVYRKGNTEMDRSKHTITFMGQKYPMNTVVRVDNFNEQAEAISKASALNVEDKLNVNGDQTIMDINEASVLLRGRSNYLESDPTKIYRCFGLATNTILTKDLMSEYMDMLKSSRDLAELVSRMCSMADALNRASIEWNTPGSQDSKVVTLCAIDNHMVKLVNRFVQNNLQLEKVSIDSFVEDYIDLEKFVANKCGPLGSLALKSFGQEVLQMTFVTNGDELAEEARSLLDLSEETDCIFLPENYSLTYLPLTDKELDYDFKDRLWAVGYGRTPIMARILDSLTVHKKQSQRTCLSDLLITQDGVVYRVYENVLGKGYLIRKDK